MGALCAYLFFSLMIFGLPIWHDFTSRYVGTFPDPAWFTWCFEWWPYAILHGQNPFVTPLVWAPTGLNLAWTASIPGPSLLASPVTLIFGPVTSYNLVTILSPALASESMLVLVWKITKNFPAAFFSGYLFGFSTYELGQNLGHTNLSIIFLIPLGAYVIISSLNSVMFSRRRLVLQMTLLLSFQFLCSVEIFATSTLFGAVLMIITYILAPKSKKTRLRQIIGGLLIAYVTTGFLILPFLYYMLVAPYSRGPIINIGPFSTDLLEYILPTPLTLLGHSSFSALTSKFTGSFVGHGAYLGIPLILMVLSYYIGAWRRWITKVNVSIALVVFFASLGTRLHIAGVSTIWMPWKVMSHVPLIDNALPDRFVMYLWIVVAITAGLWLAQSNGHQRVVVKALFVATITLTLLPNVKVSKKAWLSELGPSEPKIFAGRSYKAVMRPQSNILILPYSGFAMAWQAETGMYFRMPGGYAGNLEPGQAQSFDAWPIAQTFFSGKLIASYQPQLRRFLGAHHITKIIILPASDQSFYKDFVQSSLGERPEVLDGALVYKVPNWILTHFRSAEP